jgi:cytochrome c-type biogenesis protein CcmH
VAVPVLCVAGYLVLGQPGAGDRPFDNRMVNPADDDLYAQLDLLFQEPTLERVIRVEALLDGASVETRNSARFQEAAAFVYALAGRYGETVVAYNRYVAIGGEAADPNGGYAFVLGETIFRATDGRVTPEAEELFRLSLEGDPADVVARIYLALALQQRGEDEAAVEAYLALLELEPVGGAEWAEVVRAQLAELGVEPPPPPQEEEGFEGLTPEQLEMVNEMVGGLAVRLEENPDDVEGWAQLIRSYMVLERDDEAFAALARAREFFTGNEEAMAIIEEVEAEIARALELE